MKKIFGAKRKPIAESEVLFAGTARNVANFIDAEVQSLASNLKQFKKVYGLIIESDSSDDTIGRLEELQAKNPNITYISLGNLSQKMPKRTERLAFCRNRIVHELRTNALYSRIDYIALADLDSVNGELTPEKIAQCWTVKEDWDVITANQGDVYYDIWALRHPEWSPGDCMEQVRHLSKLFDEKTCHNLAVWAKMVHLDADKGLIPVDSAFGAFAIYKLEAYLSGDYVGLNADGREVVCHVAFHEKIRLNRYKIYINSALINCGKPTEVEAKPAKPKLRSTFALGLIQSFGNGIFGKKRFNKYLDMMKND